MNAMAHLSVSAMYPFVLSPELSISMLIVTLDFQRGAVLLLYCDGSEFQYTSIHLINEWIRIGTQNHHNKAQYCYTFQ